jgi:hypothetical protein
VQARAWAPKKTILPFQQGDCGLGWAVIRKSTGVSLGGSVYLHVSNCGLFETKIQAARGGTLYLRQCLTYVFELGLLKVK